MVFIVLRTLKTHFSQVFCQFFPVHLFNTWLKPSFFPTQLSDSQHFFSMSFQHFWVTLGSPHHRHRRLDLPRRRIQIETLEAEIESATSEAARAMAMAAMAMAVMGGFDQNATGRKSGGFLRQLYAVFFLGGRF